MGQRKKTGSKKKAAKKKTAKKKPSKKKPPKKKTHTSDAGPAPTVIEGGTAFLLGKKKMPPELPDYVGYGDENEAVAYVYDNLAAWLRTRGALEWLRDNA